MAAITSPAAGSMRRPAWTDPRLLIGLLLVIGSMAAGWLLFDRASATVAVFAATREIAAGQPIPQDALREVEVAGAVEDQRYLTPASLPDGALVAIRPVGAGELVPLAAVSTEQAQQVRPITIALGEVAPASLETGDLVDIWVVHPDNSTQAPQQVASGLAVSHVATQGSSLTSASGSRIEVLVPLDDVARILAAVAGPGEVSVMRVPGS